MFRSINSSDSLSSKASTAVKAKMPGSSFSPSSLYLRLLHKITTKKTESGILIVHPWITTYLHQAKYDKALKLLILDLKRHNADAKEIAMIFYSKILEFFVLFEKSKTDLKRFYDRFKQSIAVDFSKELNDFHELQKQISSDKKLTEKTSEYLTFLKLNEGVSFEPKPLWHRLQDDLIYRFRLITHGRTEGFKIHSYIRELARVGDIETAVDFLHRDLERNKIPSQYFASIFEENIVKPLILNFPDNQAERLIEIALIKLQSRLNQNFTPNLICNFHKSTHRNKNYQHKLEALTPMLQKHSNKESLKACIERIISDKCLNLAIGAKESDSELKAFQTLVSTIMDKDSLPSNFLRFLSLPDNQFEKLVIEKISELRGDNYKDDYYKAKKLFYDLDEFNPRNLPCDLEEIVRQDVEEKGYKAKHFNLVFEHVLDEASFLISEEVDGLKEVAMNYYINYMRYLIPHVSNLDLLKSLHKLLLNPKTVVYFANESSNPEASSSALELCELLDKRADQLRGKS